VKEIVATVERSGRVALPDEVRRRLGVEPEGAATFVITDDGRVELWPSPAAVVDSLRGAAGSLPRPLGWDEVERFAREEREDRLAAKLGIAPQR